MYLRSLSPSLSLNRQNEQAAEQCQCQPRRPIRWRPNGGLEKKKYVSARVKGNVNLPNCGTKFGKVAAGGNRIFHKAFLLEVIILASGVSGSFSILIMIIRAIRVLNCSPVGCSVVARPNIARTRVLNSASTAGRLKNPTWQLVAWHSSMPTSSGNFSLECLANILALSLNRLITFVSAF